MITKKKWIAIDKSKKKRSLIFLLQIAIAICFLLFLFLVLSKKLSFKSFLISNDKLQGIDVSHYQGEIHWETIKEQGIAFAFIKATEGSSHVDRKFDENWKQAKEAGILVGAYHFFSFDSPAKTQARLFIKTVKELSGSLLPVIDIEYYGKKEKNPPNQKTVRKQLKQLLQILEEEYGIKPMIYTTYKVYHRYIEGEFEEYPLWIRNVYYPPIDIKRQWAFWQYSDTGILDGYEGKEKYIDKNVFYGTKEQLMDYIVPNKETAKKEKSV